MPPFSMLRTKKGRKSRPRTPPSPGSFYSPARSPAPWGSAPSLLTRARSNSVAEGASRGGGDSAQDPQGSTRNAQGSIGRRAPPSAWAYTPEVDKSLPPPPARSTSKDDQGLQLDLGGPSRLGEDLASFLHSEPEPHVAARVHSRRPSASTATSSPRARTPALEQPTKPSPLAESRPFPADPKPSPLAEPSNVEVPVSGSKVPAALVEAVSGSKTSAPPASVSGSSGPEPTGTSHTHRRVPSPIKIPRTHVHAPSVTIERTPSPSSSAQPRPASPPASVPQPPPSLTPTSEPSPDPSSISESAPELMTVLRAERASAAMLGLGFTLRAPTDDRLSVIGDALRMDSATLPPERESLDGPAEGSSPSETARSSTSAQRATLRRSISTDDGLTKGASSSRPSTVYARRETVFMPIARPETVYASSSHTEVAPALETIYAAAAGGIHRISEVPSTPGSSQLQVYPASSSSSSPLRSPTRLRSKTVATPNESRRDIGRELYTIAGRPGDSSLGNRQRSATVDVNPRQVYAPAPGYATAASSSGYAYSTIKRSRSPSGATATTHPSRPVTPPDALTPAVPTHKRGKSGNANGSVMQSGAGAGSASHNAALTAQPVNVSTIQATSSPTPSSPATRLAYLESPSPGASPLVRTSRLQSAPTMAFGPASSSSGSTTLAGSSPYNGSPPGPTSILSKFARSQMGFENFSFLGTRGRSVSESTRGSPATVDGEVSPSGVVCCPPAAVPVRPARPPSLTLRDDPPEQPRLAHSNSGSSTGSGFRLTRSGSNGAVRGVGSARLRRKRSSPRQGGTRALAPERHERSASGSSGAIGLQRNGSTTEPHSVSIQVPGLQRAGSNAGSSSGSHRTAGTQQHTPTSTGSSPPPLMTLKQRRETVFPSTPRSFSQESALLDSPVSRPIGAPVPELPGFVLDGNLLMPPVKSPASVASMRKAHLPIGPKLGPVPARLETMPSTVAPAPTPAPSTGSKTATARSQPERQQQRPPSPRAQPRQPPSPTFEPIPVRWRGLTMDAAKWTFSSKQLHSIVSRAIKQSAETSSVRLLPLDVLDQELPVEVERLEQLRDVLQTKYKAQVRRRRLLMRSLALYIDGHDPPTSRRLLDELEDVGVVCDQLAEDLYLVGDQLSQISRLRDVHSTSALAVALRKINQSYIRARSEVVELQTERTSLEAERDEAWLMAETLERELVGAKGDSPAAGDSESTGCESKSRVSAARKSSIRQSKVGLRKSFRRSARSSTSGGSMRYHSIVFPRPPTNTPPFVDSAPDTSGEFVPPVPPVPTPSKRLSTMEPSRPESIGVLPSGLYALSPGAGSTGPGEPYSVVGVTSPSATSHDLFVAQNELLNMLGLSYKEFGFRLRPRSYSDSSPASSPPVSPNAHPNAPPSAYANRSKLFRSSSDQALRRHSSVDRVIAVQVPETGGVPEDPAAILAALTLPQDDL